MMKPRTKGMPWWLLFLLIFVAFVGNIVFGCYAARNTGLEVAERIYTALRESDDARVRSNVTGFALQQLAELEIKYGKVMSYRIIDAGGKPADMWAVHVEVTRERATTLEELGNLSSGNIARYINSYKVIKQ
ncbi:MAG: hypothetical protein ABIV13_04235 [Fimbriimonadales bacterium]